MSSDEGAAIRDRLAKLAVEGRPVEREALLGNWRTASCAGRSASRVLEARQRRSGLRHDRTLLSIEG